MNSQMKIFSGMSNQPLAKEIADYLGIKLSSAEILKFKDGEVFVKLLENVREIDVFIVQSTSNPANDHVMELLLMIDAALRASAKRITAVIPYFGYARQDRKNEPRVPISAKVVADIVQAVGVKRILTMDLHSDQIQGFFDIPVDNLFATPIFMDYLNNLKIKNAVVVSPDTGGAEKARFYAKNLKAGLALIDKRRPEANISEVMHVIGDVKDKNCVIVDDMVDTGGSISHAAQALKEYGAKDIYCIATHGVLSSDAVDKMVKAGFKEIIFSNTITMSEKKKHENMTIISVASLFGEAIRRIHNGESVSSLFI